MNTNELVEQVRNILLDYQTRPISDSLIMGQMGRMYRFIYNHYARSDDNMYGDIYELNIRQGQIEYELPRDLWSKRIDYFQVPTATYSPRGYVKVQKVNVKDEHLYNINQSYSTIPAAWAQWNNKIRIYPAPTTSYTARLVRIPRLVPLRKFEGKIIEFSSPTITCEEDLCDEFASFASDTRGRNVLSISDGLTGELKHILSFNSVVDNAITLTDPTIRTTINGETIETLASADFSDVYEDDVITLGYGTGVSIFGEAFDSLLIDSTARAIRSSLNESQSEIQDIYKDMLQQLQSDRSGRPSISRIERVQRVPNVSIRMRRGR